MKLIVGLGNIGKEYEHTRHNMGFDVVDLLLKKHNLELNKEDFKGCFVKTKLFDEDVIILKPSTYMNLSGESVILFMNYFKISYEDLLVIYDDMDLPPGSIRLRESGSSGGQKGMKNIIELVHTDNIKRIRIGIGKANKDVVDYVLTRPSLEDASLIKSAQEKAVDAIEIFLKDGFKKAISKKY